MTTKYVLPIQYDEDGDEYYITLPEDIVANMDLQDGDILSWEETSKNIFALKKRKTEDADRL
jgi:hypothetical protein